jgi:hypothetical protein
MALIGFAACDARLGTSRRRGNSSVQVRESSLNAIACYGRQETVGLLAGRAVQEVA